jgi:hypothetical protein
MCLDFGFWCWVLQLMFKVVVIVVLV